MAAIKTLVGFDGRSGASPYAALVADSAGNLFGTTQPNPGSSDGYAFEIAKTAAGYAATPTLLASVSPTDGGAVLSGLLVDGAGNLFGTTAGGGATDRGRVFEIAKAATGYASAAVTLASFDGTDGSHPHGGLVADAAGELFGTTSDGGSGGVGTVYEVAKTPTGYAAAKTLVDFGGANGANPQAALAVDAAGNLFGTTLNGGAYGEGSVFEVAKTATGYDGAATTLASFGRYPAGTKPNGALVLDAAGNLFGTTSGSGPYDQGTVFEIAKAAVGYSQYYSDVATFSGADGSAPTGSLILDAAGNLFGTTSGGGANGVGTVFEVARSRYDLGRYDPGATPYSLDGVTTLADFSGANGGQPQSNLVADGVGNLFGTTGGGGASNHGTAFELVGAGFQSIAISGARGAQPLTDGSATPFSTVTVADANVGSPVTVTVELSSAANGALSHLGGGLYDAASGVYTDVGTPAAVTAALRGLVFTAAAQADPTATTDFAVTAADPSGVTATASATSVNATELVTLTGFGLAFGPRYSESFDPSPTSVLLDPAGNLFGGTSSKFGNDVFQLAKTGSGYAAVTTTLSYLDTLGDGYLDASGMVTDAAGNIFGATGGIGDSPGQVFEIPKSGGGPNDRITLVQFPYAGGSPGDLVLDGTGNLFGTQLGNPRTVFEIAKTASGYAAAATTVATLPDGSGPPSAGLTIDAADNLLGVTDKGGPEGGGTVFEVARTPGGYATPTTLATFKGDPSPYGGGVGPNSRLVADAAGNLFGTTAGLGANNRGEVFEIARTLTGYAPATVLASFDGIDGSGPSGVIVGAGGSLFGTAYGGGSFGQGTVFKLSKVGPSSTPAATTETGYATAPTTLVVFNGLNGSSPEGLVADAAGDLFGSTQSGGPGGNGSLFELRGSGFAGAGAATPNVIDGPAGGHALLQGTVGRDVITAHGLGNTVFGYGGADRIDAGAGQAYVDVGFGSANVTLGGGGNVVVGDDAGERSGGNNVITGAPCGQTSVTLGNGDNSVTIGGQGDTILLGDGKNFVGGTQGAAFITTGWGDDTIVLGGGHNTVSPGGGTNTITGGSGSDTFVLPSNEGFSTDLIAGFTEGNGDVLDLRGALHDAGWDFSPDTLSNYVKATDGNGGTTLSVVGSGGSAAAIVVLIGAGNLGLSDLVSHHSLLTVGTS